MRIKHGSWSGRAAAVAAILLALGAVAPVNAAKGKLWQGEWVITITAPDSDSGYHFGVKTFTIKAMVNDAPPSPLPLQQLTATSDEGVTVQGVWRQKGKKFSLTFELSCGEVEACSTVVLRGKMKSKTRMTGQAILVLDVRDRRNAAGYETVNGTFEGFQQ
ncbi:MAG TPA: hypothetical protein VF762_04570 [Blastocatellia bacterium]|jgi:hypothetical protein